MAIKEEGSCAYTKLGEHAITIYDGDELLVCVRAAWLAQQRAEFIAVSIGKDASYLTTREKIARAPTVSHKQGSFHAMPVWSWELQGVVGYMLASMMRSGVHFGLKLPQKFFNLPDD